MSNNYRDDLIVMMGMVDRAVMKPKFTYPMHENAPRPPVDSYASIRVRKIRSPSTDVTYDRYINNNLYQIVEGIRVITFDILFSRDDEESAWFEGCFNRRDIIDYMKSKGYGVLTHGILDEQDIVRETTWEVRTGFTVDVSVVRRFYMHPDMVQSGLGTHHQAVDPSGGTDDILAVETNYDYFSDGNTTSGTITVDKDDIIPPTT